MREKTQHLLARPYFSCLSETGLSKISFMMIASCILPRTRFFRNGMVMVHARHICIGICDCIFNYSIFVSRWLRFFSRCCFSAGAGLRTLLWDFWKVGSLLFLLLGFGFLEIADEPEKNPNDNDGGTKPITNIIKNTIHFRYTFFLNYGGNCSNKMSYSINMDVNKVNILPAKQRQCPLNLFVLFRNSFSHC